MLFDIMKTCNTCSETKPFDSFYKGAAYADGYRPKCKQCVSDYHKERNSKPEQKIKQREWSYNRLYGISIEEYNRLSESQNHACKICGSLDSRRGNNFLMIDHNHETGEVRGLLCSPCNSAIGMFEDDISRLQSAINYLS